MAQSRSKTEIISSYVEKPFSHTEIVEKEKAMLAMQEYADQEAVAFANWLEWRGTGGSPIGKLYKEFKKEFVDV